MCLKNQLSVPTADAPKSMCQRVRRETQTCLSQHASTSMPRSACLDRTTRSGARVPLDHHSSSFESAQASMSSQHGPNQSTLAWAQHAHTRSSGSTASVSRPRPSPPSARLKLEALSRPCLDIDHRHFCRKSTKSADYVPAQNRVRLF